MSEQSKQPTTEMTKTEFVGRTLRIGIWGAHVVLSDSGLVKFAERSTMRHGGVAERCLEWYLNANGHDLPVEVSSLLRDDPTFRRRLIDDLKGELLKQPPRDSGRLNYKQEKHAITNIDWLYAIGSINMDWRIVSRDPAHKQVEVEVSFLKPYVWHPHQDRPTHYVHQAAQNLQVLHAGQIKRARNYRLIGKPTRLRISE